MKKLLTYSLVVGILSVLVVHVGNNTDVLRAVEWGRHPWMLVVHVLLLVLMFTFFVVGWKLIMTAVGSSLSWKAAAASWLVPNLGKYLPGKVAMVAGRIELVRAEGVRRSVAGSAMVYENATQAMASIPFLAIALASGFQFGNTVTGWSVVAILVGGGTLYVRPESLTKLLNKALLRMNREPLDVTPGRRALLQLLGVETLSWVAYALSGVFLARALGLADETGSLTLGVSFVASWLLGYLSFLTPGGLGVREVVFVALVSGSSGSAEATTLALVARIIWTLVEMVGVAFGLWIKR